jgi:hypothetical protein
MEWKKFLASSSGGMCMSKFGDGSRNIGSERVAEMAVEQKESMEKCQDRIILRS